MKAHYDRICFRMQVRTGHWLPLKRLGKTLALALTLAATAHAQTAAKPWSPRDTRLANEYLSLLVQQPEYGRVLELLWTLYEKHDATKLLVENVSQQAANSKFLAVKIVEAHLVRHSGDLKKAAELYDALLKQDAKNLILLQSRAAVARELGDSATAYTLTKRAAEQIPPGDAQAPALWIELGGLAQAAGKTKEAADAYETAAKLKPEDLDLARQVAQLLLQSGSPQRAASFFSKLVNQKDPQRKLDALYDLARIYEHADQFEKADAALKEGLSLLHFRDGRYLDFFRRRVRLHEHFGLLEDLEKSLTVAAKAIPPSEEALLNITRFFDLTVNVDEHLHWLRALVQAIPQVEDYRWALVRSLLDHEGAAEAAKLLDERLKNNGTDLPAIVLLRCEADLRLGTPEAAANRLLQLLTAQPAAEVEKQVLTFAQARALDSVVEKILRTRVERDPQQAEAVFELAGYFRSRRDLVSEDKLLRDFSANAPNEAERQKRLSDASAFLAASNNVDSAIILAREAVSKPGASREAWLHLAGLLAEQGENEEASEWVEKAWLASTTDEDRVDVDERLLSILMGDQKAPAKPATAGDFKLPDAFTGAGFGADPNEAAQAKELPERVIEFAQKLIANAQKADMQTPVGRAAVFRGFWWALRTNQTNTAYDLLGRLQFERPLAPQQPPSLTLEQLKLDLAQADDNAPLTARQLRLLSTLDPAARIPMTLRLAELLLENERKADAANSNPGWKTDTPFPPLGVAAAELLESVYRENPDSAQLLSALTTIYFLQRRPDDALALWKQAVRRASGPAAIPLLESYADILLRQHRILEHVEAQVQLIEREPDLKRKREALRRCIDRLTYSDASGGELSQSVIRDRLQMLERALLSRVQQHPFEGFYHEALAQVYARSGDHGKAFASMKQAYYTAPDTPFSLDQLREAALKVSDIKAAIYFQKQIAAAAPPKEVAAESRRLVELLEQTFQIAEADKVRRRLESRFSQDAAALEELAKYYQSSGQDEAERRVYEQMARIRAWDGRARLRLALKCLRFADETAAETHLLAVLAAPVKAGTYPTRGTRAPLPLTNTRRESSGVTTSDLVPLLDFAPGLERKELDTLRAFLGQPRAEFAELPEDGAMVRLRAIEELSKLRRQSGGPSLTTWIQQWNSDTQANDVEKLWAFYASGAEKPFRLVLQKILPELNTLEARFARLWLTLRSHGMEEVILWAKETGWSSDVIRQRSELLHSSLSMLMDVADFRFREEELRLLGDSKALSNVAIIDLTRKLQDKQRYDEALALGASLQNSTPEMQIGVDHLLARIAESAERWDLALHYLEQALNVPVTAENYRSTYDPFLLSLASMARLAPSAQRREQTLQLVWQRLQRTQPSAMTSIRKAAVEGLAGAQDQGAKTLGKLLGGPFLVQREMSESHGSLMPQGSSRYEEPLHLRSLWEETREIQALFVQQGLSGLVNGANTKLASELGTTMLGPRSDSEFGEWRINELLARLRPADYPTRLRLIREHLASVDFRTEHSVDTLGNLGSRLETVGMSREALSIYRQLPPRAPSNPEYAQWLLRASETAQEIEPGLSFSRQLLLAEPPLKPPALGDDTLREKHALFLAWDFNLDELKRRGFREHFSQVLERRRPHEISYLRELGLLLERMKDDKAALSAWERMHAAYVANDQAGTDLDPEANLHRAQILQRLAQHQAALKVLRDVPLADPLDPTGQEVLKLRCQLATDLADTVEIRDLMTQCVERRSLACVVALATGLRGKGRITEALNLLTQADRTLKGDHERFTLRLEQIKALAQEASWSAQRGRAQISALFRASTRDRDTLKDLHTWLQNQADRQDAKEWISALRTESQAGADKPLAALALSAFTPKLPEEARNDFNAAWLKTEEKDRICIELTAEALLLANRPSWAWDACQVIASIPTLREQGRKVPLAVRVAHKLQDEVTIRDLFNDTLRLTFPGGAQTITWTEAFEDTGHINLARELFTAALERLDTTSTLQPELYAAYTRFLIRQKEFDAAEAFLIRMNWGMPTETAKLIFELHQSWGKLPEIEPALPKFRLPTAIRKEVLFLARQAGISITLQP